MNENENNTQNGMNQSGNGYSSFSPNNYNGPVVVANAVPEKNGGKAVASLVCGILSILGSWSFVSIGLSIAGIILGIINLVQKNPQKGMAIAGIILSVLGFLLVWVFIFIYAVAML